MPDDEEIIETNEAQVNEGEQPPEVEARARRMGWRPQDEWNGPANRWVDAEAFVAKADESVPVMRERMKRLDSDLAARDRRIEQLERTSKTLEAMGQQAIKAAVEQAKREMRAAVETGDTEAFEKAEKALEAATAEPKSNGEARTTRPEDDPDLQAWRQDNPWFNNDIKMTVFANQAARILAEKHNIGLGPELYAKITEAVREEFPDKFENPRRKQPGTVEPGGGRGSGGRKGFNELPAETRKSFQQQADSFGYEGDERKAFLNDAAKIYFEDEANA